MWTEVGPRPCLEACGLCTQGKQRDRFPWDPGLWSGVAVTPGPRRRWYGARAVQDNAPPGPSYVQSEQKIPCTKLEGCWPHTPHKLIILGQTAVMTYTHPCAGTCDGRSVSPKVPVLRAWRCSQDSCVERTVTEVRFIENPVIDC